MKLLRLPNEMLYAKSIRIDIEPSKPTWGNELIRTQGADFYRINERHDVMVKFSQDDPNRSIYDLLVTKDSVQALVTWFPNIKRLTIVVTRCANQELSSVLSLWPKLTELTVVGFPYVVRHELLLLSHSINELKSLKALVLDVALYQLDLSIFGQLEHLTCRLQKHSASSSEHHLQRWSKVIIETMTLHPNIKTMGLWLDYTTGFIDYSNWPSQVTNRITRLIHQNSVRSTLDVICDKFSSLTYLHFGPNSTRGFTLTSALPSLFKLQHLQVLHLRIEGEPPAKDSNLPQLKSVKRVTFLNPLDPHQLMAFDAFFPNALRVGFEVDKYDWPSLQKLLCNKAHCANCAFLLRHSSLGSAERDSDDEETIRVWLD